MRKFVVSALTAACVAGLGAAPAAAEEFEVRVDYADLDIESAEGARTLGKRIEAAAESACLKPSTFRDLKATLAWENCKDEAMSDALTQLSVHRTATVAVNLAAMR